MERSPAGLILLCALCLRPGAAAAPGTGTSWAAAPGQSRAPGPETPVGLEPPSGAGPELPLEPELPSRAGPEPTLGLGPEPPSGSELKPTSEQELELPSGSEPPSGSGQDLPSGSGPEPPSGSGSALPSGSIPTLPSGPGSAPAALSPALRLHAAVVLGSSPCSVTCGPGVREQRLCELSAAGEPRNCSLVLSRCLSSWLCGLRQLRIPEGQPVQLTCLSAAAARREGTNVDYIWSFARGLISTNELLLEPLGDHSPALSLQPALPAHSGTYRCDVRERRSARLLQRIHFGLRVIPADLLHLRFQNPPSRQQRPGNASGSSAAPGFWDGLGPPGLGPARSWEALLGLGSGVTLGLLLSIGLRCLRRHRGG